MSNGLIKSLEIRYTFRVWIHAGRCGFIMWECHTCPFLVVVCYNISPFFLYLKECVIILKFWSTVSCGLTGETRLTRHKPIAWPTHLLDCMKCSTLNGDPFTRWSHSSENEAFYGRIVVCLSQEQLGYLTQSIKFTEIKTSKLLNKLCGHVSIPPP